MVERFSGIKYYWFSIFLLFNLLLPTHGNGFAMLCEREVIKAEVIRNSGIRRVADILLLADSWKVNSTDGYTWRVSANGLSSFQRQKWIVMLDGQKIELDSFGLVNLNMLPVVTDEIDSVEIFNHPRLHEGEFTDGGLIHIHTTKPRPGISIYGYATAGSETKDAGPYKNTQYSTPNIDRSGSDLAATLTLSKNNWYFRTGLVNQEHLFSDPAMLRRNRNIQTGGYMELNSILSFFKAGIETNRGGLDLFATSSTAEKYFLFFKPAGREIPVDLSFYHVGINGNFPISEYSGLTYRFKYSRHQIEKFPNTLDFDFDWKSESLNANVETDFGCMLYKSKLGIGFGRLRLHTNYPLENNYCDVGKIYGSVNYRLTDNVQQGIDAFAVFSEGKTGIKGAFQNNWKVNENNALKTILSFSQRLFEEDNSLWFWSKRGYNLLKEYDIEYTIIGNFDKSSQFTVDIIWEYNLNPRLTFETAGSYRYFDHLYLERQNFTFHPEDCSFSSPTQIYTGADGQTLGGHCSLEYCPVRRLSNSIYYSYHTPIAEDYVFKDVYKSIPKHKASYRLTYTLDNNFSIWAMLSYLSESDWTDYSSVDGKSCVLSNINVSYSSTVESSMILDVQFQKWLWQRKLVTSLIFRNVLDGNHRYHPIGASFDLSYYILIKGFFSIISS